MKLAFFFLPAIFLFSAQNLAANPLELIGSRYLSDEDLNKASFGGTVKVKQARVIIDNDASFESKLNVVRSAHAGETIRLVYFIYSDDESSSLFSQELLAAARRGVRVKILVDLITNYKMFDLFKFLETESNGNIQVNFYGRPTENIIRDVIYMTSPCELEATPPAKSRYECQNYKLRQSDLRQSGELDWYGRLMLAGMYGKNALALKTAVMMGQSIDPSKPGQSNPTEDEQEQLKEFLKLVYKAQIKGDPIAAIKVFIALQLYGPQLNPVLNEIFGRIPLNNMVKTSFQDWEHFSDYTHHKMLLVENRLVQIGGRNQENSYHMKPNDFSAKYIFMDTDIWMDLKSGGNSLAKAYDELASFKAMSISLKEAEKLMPNVLLANPEAALMTIEKCMRPILSLMDRKDFSTCVDSNLPTTNGYLSLEERMNRVKNQMEIKAANYRHLYYSTMKADQTWKNSNTFDDYLSPADAEQLVATYLENVPYSRRKKIEDRERLFGSTAEQEFKFGKAIHHVWQRGMENVCRKAEMSGMEQRIILHSAYFIPSSGLLNVMRKMMDGTWDCRNVRVTFLTNSFETTDLNVINLVARYQMLAFFDLLRNKAESFGPLTSGRGARFDYFEYVPSSKKTLSLHTKLTVLGDDVLIGSANADVRSAYMDTNNAFLLRGAVEFASDYTKWVDSLLADPTQTRNLTPIYIDGSLSMKLFFEQDRTLLELMMKRFGFLNKLKPETKERLIQFAQSVGTFTYETTKKILNKNLIPTYGEGYLEAEETQVREQKELEQRLDRFLQIL